MNQGLIPSRYAKALYKFAVEKGKADRVYVLMKNLEAAFAAQPRLQEVMNNPYIAVDDKTRLLMTAAEAEKTDSCYVDFLKLLVENKRIDFSRGIALAYLDIYREENNIYLVRLITAGRPAAGRDRQAARPREASSQRGFDGVLAHRRPGADWRICHKHQLRAPRCINQ